MKPDIRRILELLVVTFAFVIAACAARAEVTRVEISSRQDVLGGKSFGSVGPYEKLSGRVYFAIDPKNPHNKIVADLDKAPKDAQGRVEFTADLFILRLRSAVEFGYLGHCGRNVGLAFLNLPQRI